MYGWSEIQERFIEYIFPCRSPIYICVSLLSFSLSLPSRQRRWYKSNRITWRGNRLVVFGCRLPNIGPRQPPRQVINAIRREEWKGEKETLLYVLYIAYTYIYVLGLPYVIFTRRVYTIRVVFTAHKRRIYKKAKGINERNGEARERKKKECGRMGKERRRRWINVRRTDEVDVRSREAEVIEGRCPTFNRALSLSLVL